MHTTVYKINNKDLLYNTANYIQYCINNYGKELKNRTCVYMYN